MITLPKNKKNSIYYVNMSEIVISYQKIRDTIDKQTRLLYLYDFNGIENKATITTYTTPYKDTIMKWLEKVYDTELLFTAPIEIKKELKNNILSRTNDYILFMISECEGYININKLQVVALTCFILVIKRIVSENPMILDHVDQLIPTLSPLCAGACPIQIMVAMEEDMRRRISRDDRTSGDERLQLLYLYDKDGKQNRSNILPYTTAREKILFNWLDQVYDTCRDHYFNPHVYQIMNKNEKHDLKRIIMSCTNDMILFIIRKCKQNINIKKLEALGLACFIVALKVIGAHDLLLEHRIVTRLSRLCAGDCQKQLVLDMEADILRRTNYLGCHGIIGIKDEEQHQENARQLLQQNAKKDMMEIDRQLQTEFVANRMGKNQFGTKQSKLKKYGKKSITKRCRCKK